MSIPSARQIARLARIYPFHATPAEEQALRRFDDIASRYNHLARTLSRKHNQFLAGRGGRIAVNTAQRRQFRRFIPFA